MWIYLALTVRIRSDPNEVEPFFILILDENGVEVSRPRLTTMGARH